MKKKISTTQTAENIGLVMELLGEIPGRLAQLSQGLTDEELRRPVAPGERSFVETLAHIINCESRSAEGIYSALLVQEPLVVKIHPERQLGRLWRIEEQPFADLLAYFTFRRKVLLRVLGELSESQWSRVIQEEGKARKESVYWQARGLALHEQEHLTELENKLNQEGVVVIEQRKVV